jgi:hypothetical protein
MDRYIEIASQWGVAGLIILAIGAFVYFKIWPAFTKFVADVQADKKAELDRFEAALDKKDVLIEKIVDKHTLSLEKMTNSMTGEFSSLKDEVRSAIGRMK